MARSNSLTYNLLEIRCYFGLFLSFVQSPVCPLQNTSDRRASESLSFAKSLMMDNQSKVQSSLATSCSSSGVFLQPYFHQHCQCSSHKLWAKSALKSKGPLGLTVLDSPTTSCGRRVKLRLGARFDFTRNANLSKIFNAICKILNRAYWVNLKVKRNLQNNLR